MTPDVDPISIDVSISKKKIQQTSVLIRLIYAIKPVNGVKWFPLYNCTFQQPNKQKVNCFSIDSNSLVSVVYF